MRYFKAQFLCWLMFIIVLTACEDSRVKAVTCTELFFLKSQISRHFSAADLLDWIDKTYSVPTSEVTVYKSPVGEITSYQWKKDGYYYSVALKNDTLYRFRVIKDGGGGVSVHILIQCFGEPELYHADFYEEINGNGVNFKLLFPDQGVYASGSESSMSIRRSPPEIDEKFEMDTISISEPGSPEEVMQRMGENNPNWTYQEALERMKPWPGTIESIEIPAIPEKLH